MWERTGLDEDDQFVEAVYNNLRPAAPASRE